MHTPLLCVCAQSCPTLFDSMECNLPDSFIHGISQARLLEWVAILFSRVFSRHRDGAWVFCIGRWILYHWANLGSPFPLPYSLPKIRHLNKKINLEKASLVLPNWVSGPCSVSSPLPLSDDHSVSGSVTTVAIEAVISPAVILMSLSSPSKGEVHGSLGEETRSWAEHEYPASSLTSGVFCGSLFQCCRGRRSHWTDETACFLIFYG